MSEKRKKRPKIDHPYVFSVSQVLNYLRCNHKWALEKIDGEIDPGSDSTELGGEVHDQLEKYLEKGTPIRTNQAGRIAMSALPHLPPPKFPGMEVEEWFTVFIPGVEGVHGKGAYFQGLKDVQIPKGWRSNRPFVSDHKTTKNFMWAKTPEDLTGGENEIGDLQAGLYAFDAMLKTGADAVDLQWTYMRTTSSPLAEPTIALITREQVERIMEDLALTVQEMIRTKDEHPTAATVPQNPLGCDAFGGCCFKKTKCSNLGPKDKLRAIMTQEKKENSVLSRLKERKAAKGGGEGASAAASAPAGDSPPASETQPKVDVNPPEGVNAVEPAIEEKQTKAKSTKASSKVGKVSATAQSPTQAPASAPASRGVLSRAFDAFWDVLVEDVASRIAEKLNK
jgi:hypothetical protein